MVLGVQVIEINPDGGFSPNAHPISALAIFPFDNAERSPMPGLYTGENQEVSKIDQWYQY
jgi:hypothetical protein